MFFYLLFTSLPFSSVLSVEFWFLVAAAFFFLSYLAYIDGARCVLCVLVHVLDGARVTSRLLCHKHKTAAAAWRTAARRARRPLQYLRYRKANELEFLLESRRNGAEMLHAKIDTFWICITRNDETHTEQMGQMTIRIQLKRILIWNCSKEALIHLSVFHLYLAHCVHTHDQCEYQIEIHDEHFSSFLLYAICFGFIRANDGYFLIWSKTKRKEWKRTQYTLSTGFTCHFTYKLEFMK